MAAETLRDWLRDYRAGGFDALYPKPRSDRGQPRRLPPAAAELVLAIKTEHPAWSVRHVIEHANAAGQLPDGVRLARSTACCWSASPSCAADSPWRSTNRSASAWSSVII